MNLTATDEPIIRLSRAENIKEIEARWAAESEARIDAVNRGDLQVLDGPTALLDLRSTLTK